MKPGELTIEQRRIVDLLCKEGLTHEQVAERLNISVLTVRNQMTRVFIRLGIRPIARVCYDLGAGRIR